MNQRDWPPFQSGIRDVLPARALFGCLRCEALRAGAIDNSIPDHDRACRWRAAGRDPTPAELRDER